MAVVILLSFVGIINYNESNGATLGIIKLNFVVVTINDASAISSITILITFSNY